MRVRDLPIRFVLGLAVALWAFASGISTARAQQPKLDLTFHLGASVATFVPRAEGHRHPENHAGLQLVFGARYRHRQLMLATNLAFRFWSVVSFTKKFVEESELDPALIGTDVIGYALEVPFVAGYIPYKNPYFKLFLYGGLVNQFNLRFRIVEPNGRTERVSARDVSFPVYQALARLGVSFDITLFNFDLNYGIGLNSATQTDTRTNLHVAQLNVGMVF